MKKIEQALEIVNANPDKKVALDKLVEMLGITRANAYVYYAKVTTKADKPAKAEKPVKAEKVVKAARKTNPITGLTGAKAEKKIAEIDKVIAGLRASGATVASPFPV